VFSLRRVLGTTGVVVVAVVNANTNADGDSEAHTISKKLMHLDFATERG
jgi:hypothetical protein